MYERHNSKTKKIIVTIGDGEHSGKYNFEKLKEKGKMKPLGKYSVEFEVSRKGVTKEFRVFDPEHVEEEGTNILDIMT